jgi:ribonuclease D
MDRVEIVTQQKPLVSYCEQWRRGGWLAFDTEFIRDETYEAALCLVQVATDQQVVLIDPVAELDLSPFWELITDPQVTAVVHAGKEDFELCLRATGRPPRNVFDVQIAAGLLGYGYPLSLSRLVAEVVGRRISKAQTLTDWLRRPLTQAQIRYAIEDVVHLPQIYLRLRGELEQRGRLSWALEEFARFEDPQLYEPPVRERLFRLRGTKRLDGLGLAVLERLVEWRDRWARQKNRPLRAMMRDDVLVEIARRRPRRASDLEVLRGFPQARNPKVIRELLALIEEASQTPPEKWPAPYKPPKELPMSEIMLDILSAVTRAACEEQQVSHDLLCTTQRLREVLDYRAGLLSERPLMLRGWREEFIGRRLLELLDGHSELHICGWPDKPRLQLVTRRSARAIPEQVA